MKGHIPQETSSFVGRRPELALLDAALATHRLVTLTGAGGVGKTRLARRAAARAGGAFPDGVWWADLATLANPELLSATVSDAVKLADHSPRMPVEALCEWLADKRLLLVLDSCEHLAADCAHLAGELLTTAPGLTIMATSRVPLACGSEAVFEVSPLPADGADALALFTARITDRLGLEALSEPGAAEAAESICRRLEGIPLAIELAAAQVGPAAVAEIAARLGSRFDVLTRSGIVWPRRHQTLRTAIGWSHELCAPLERLLWARLTVFRGSFDLASARAVTAGGPLGAEDVQPVLERLVAQCVVRRDGDRYRMLETIREYGEEWLRELGEDAEVARRHAEHFTRLARWAECSWIGSEQAQCYRLVEAAHTDLRTALDHWLTEDPRQAAELAGLLVFFWTCCGHIKEARGYLERALAAGPVPGPARTRALTALCVTVTLQGEYVLAARLSREAVGAAAEDGDKEAQLRAAYAAGVLSLLLGEAEQARRVVAGTLAAVPGFAFDSPARLRCHLVQVFALTALGDLDGAQVRAVELRRHLAQAGEIWTRSYLDYQLALIALLRGAPHAAVTHARAVLESKRLIGDTFGIALGLDLLAAALAADGAAEQAASVYGTGEAFWRSVGHPQRGTPELRAVRERCEATARAALGERGYASAYARGNASHDINVLADMPVPPPEAR